MGRLLFNQKWLSLAVLLVLFYVFYLLLIVSYNKDYLVQFSLFFAVFSFSMIALMRCCRSNIFLHPLFYFDLAYFLIFATTDCLSLFYEKKLAWLIVLMFFSLNFGVWSVLFLKSDNDLSPKLKVTHRSYSEYVFFSLLISSIILGIYFIKYGIPLFSVNINSARTIQNEGSISAIYQIIQYNSSCAITIFIFSIIKNSKYKINKINLVLSIITIIQLLLFANRTNLFYIFMTIIFLSFVLTRRVKFKYIAIILLFVVGVSVFGAYRNTNRFDNFLYSIASEAIAIKFNLYTLFAGYNKTFPLEWGALQLRGIAVVLPGHQLDTSLYLKDKLGLDFDGGGMTPSLVGQFYADFGMVGAMIEIMFFGILLHIYYRRTLFSGDEIGWVIYSYLMVYWIYVIRNGLLYSPSVVFVLMFFYFSRYRIRQLSIFSLRG